MGTRRHAIHIDGELPQQPGWNASLTATLQHDSDDGWLSLLTPDVAYRFDEHFSMDASMPVFTRVETEVNTGTTASDLFADKVQHHALGDLQVDGSYEKPWKDLHYTATLTVGLPTGKTYYGLGAGKVTYGLSNHVERTYGDVTPDLEIAVGNSSNAVGAGPTLPYVANATFLYFQVGATVGLTDSIDFHAQIYEALPLTRATLYSTTSRGSQNIVAGQQEATGEDNGFNASIDIPILPHTVLSGFYTRSLVDRYDLAGFSLTFSLRPGARRTRY